MAKKATVLLIEDIESLATLYKEYILHQNCQVTHAATGSEAIAHIEKSPPDIVLLDLGLPDIPGLNILRKIHAESLPITVIVITASGSVDVAVDAMRYGAFDFLVKPFDGKRFSVTLKNALEQIRLAKIVETYKSEFGRDHFEGFIGSSLPMQAVYRIIESAAPSRATVFITGESGTGKEVCARAIHARSDRRDQPFVALNCAAIPRELMESEIFGHTKGAFTGATSAREGAAARADGGTLFLDEICEMDPGLQSKLLRFIQTGAYQRVGGTREEKIDLRILCATNRDPWTEVQAGRFREDLFYRLHVIPVELPPLRERGEDILAIAGHLLTQYAKEESKSFKGFADDVRDRLLSYEWPGNVRQLQNMLRNIVVLHDAEWVTANLLPVPLSKHPSKPNKSSPVAQRPPSSSVSQAGESLEPEGTVQILPLGTEERRIIERAIAHCDGNIPKAAALLEVSPSTIYRKRQAWSQGG
jgi:DNA-binding NtrC family response regulator